MVSRTITNQYVPDYAVHPGQILEDYLEGLQMTQKELARRTGIVLKHINEILQGKAPITQETALKLERVIGRPASLWNNLQRLYEEDLVRLAETQHLAEQHAWLDHFPLREMIRHGWIQAFKDKSAQIAELLRFFAVASPECWQEFWDGELVVEFRQSQTGAIWPGAVAAWLRRGEILAQEIPCAAFDRAGFKAVLTAARAYTRDSPAEVFQSRLVAECARVGVALVLVPDLPHTGLAGATRWLTSHKALLQLSLRYRRTDHLWFSFYHEAGHILLHGKRDRFLEGASGLGTAKESEANCFAQGASGLDLAKEDEANRFAADWLIPPTQWRSFLDGFQMRLDQVGEFADDIGIDPGIVVGRLQHEKVVPFTWGNGFKTKMVWG